MSLWATLMPIRHYIVIMPNMGYYVMRILAEVGKNAFREIVLEIEAGVVAMAGVPFPLGRKNKSITQYFVIGRG